MKITQSWLLTGCLLAASSFVAQAQEKPVPMPPSDGTFKVLGARPAAGKVVKGAPYSATAVTETVQTLGDGNQIIRRNETTLYRDSEGRTRTEQTLKNIGKWKAEGEGNQIITISDPVAGWSASLDPHTRTAQKALLATQAKIEELQKQFEELQKMGKENKSSKPSAAEAAMPTIIPSKNAKAWELQAGVSGDPRKKIEQLGKQVIEGVETIGTRSTYTIPAGEIGNTLPIAIVEETWYSPALDLMVLTKSQDPRSGATTYRLTNLQRNEPDRALFEIPADYTLTKSLFPVKTKPVKEEE